MWKVFTEKFYRKRSKSMFVVSICKENYCHRYIVKFIESGLSCGDYADFVLVYWPSEWFKWNSKHTALK